MAKKISYKCSFCLKNQMRYTETHRVCDACGLRQKKAGRGNRRGIKPNALKTSRNRGKIKSGAFGNRRTTLSPQIEALLMLNEVLDAMRTGGEKIAKATTVK